MPGHVWWFLGVLSFGFHWGCSEQEILSGNFLEMIEPSPEETYTQGFGLQLELFQFGTEVGGIVRYHSTRGVVDEESPFNNEELACFWTKKTTYQGDQFTVSYLDHLGQDSVLTLTGSPDSNLLMGRKFIRGRRDAENEPPDNNRDLLLERDNGKQANNNCLNPLVDFSFDLDFEGPLVSATQQDQVIDGVLHRPTVGLFWLGDPGLPEPGDWFFRTQGADSQGQLPVTRRLPPGRAVCPNTMPYIDGRTDEETGEAFRLIMGVPMVYLDRAGDDASLSGEVSTSWEPSEMPLGTIFERVDGEETLYHGKVLIYTERGDNTPPPAIIRGLLASPEKCPAHAVAGFSQNFRQGYGFYEIEAELSIDGDFTVSSVCNLETLRPAIELFLNDPDETGYDAGNLPSFPRL